MVVDRFDMPTVRGRSGWCASSDAPRRAQCSAGSNETPLGRWSFRRPADSLEEGSDECIRIERQEIADPLPHPHEPYRDVKRVLDREDDPALGGRIELREHDARQTDRLMEGLRLGEPVLPGRRV